MLTILCYKPKRNIFISYKRVGKEKVFKIKDHIESALGEKCWIDLDGIESDAIFASKIIGAINNCKVFLFMYSQAHKDITDYENDWTIRELNFAQEKKKRIVFINIDGSELSDWFNLLFGLKQQVDATILEGIIRLTCDINKWLDYQIQEDKQSYFPRNECRNLDWLVEEVKQAEKINISIIHKNGRNYFCSNGRIQQECKYDIVEHFIGGIAIVHLYGKLGVINSNLQEIIPCEYEELWPEYSELLIEAVKEGKSGTFLWNGERLIPNTFECTCYIQPLGEQLKTVECDGKEGLFDMSKEALLIPCTYESAYLNHYYKVIHLQKDKNTLAGCVDFNNNVVIPFEYDSILYFSHGLAIAIKKGKIGYIDITGSTVIPFEYDEGLDYYGHVAYCRKDFIWYKVDSNGNPIKTIYDCIFDMNGAAIEIPDVMPISPFYIVKVNGKSGTIDAKGDVLIPCIYDVIGFTEHPCCIIAELSGNEYYFDIKGKPISLEIRERINTYKDYWRKRNDSPYMFAKQSCKE